MARVSIELPIPPTLNVQIGEARKHWSKSSNLKREWTDNIALLSERVPQFPGSVWLDFNWHVKSKKQDPDNIAAAAKYLMDGFVKAGVIRGDSLTTIQSPVVHRYGKGQDVVIVTISSTPIYRLEVLPDCCESNQIVCF